MSQCYFVDTIDNFLEYTQETILGELTKNCEEPNLEDQQRNAWLDEIFFLKKWLRNVKGGILLEYNIPRMGKRVDCVVISGPGIFVIEFKIGATIYDNQAKIQVTDYALDLKNFHEQSHDQLVVPILICTEAPEQFTNVDYYNDGLAKTILTNGSSLKSIIDQVCNRIIRKDIDYRVWVHSRYKPTPTIIEAAQSLYQNHTVREILSYTSGADNLSTTAKAVHDIIQVSKNNNQKSICFITGVPGAGKTLAGLNLANSWHDEKHSEHAVFLSGNGPLVKVLSEALARNKIEVAREKGTRLTRNQSLREVKSFIQPVHRFRDYYHDNRESLPIEKVVIFDEAQRAWTSKQTASFMKRKKNIHGFNQSEPEFLISVMDRHDDWAVIVCLIGGGQEINTGEAGLHEWFESLRRSFPRWNVYISNRLTDDEYTQGSRLFDNAELNARIFFYDDLHLAVSLRSFRSEKVAEFVKTLLDCEREKAKEIYHEISRVYPIILTRNIDTAKNWLRSTARGSERYGVIASSGGIRLKPYAINVKNELDPENWFLNGLEDVRSSYFMEDTATEFDIQGLELDWACVAWDADFRYDASGWAYNSFKGTKWHKINNEYVRRYLKNAYRVLLTRARQGMVIFVPKGSTTDKTRESNFYNNTYDYLRSIGIIELG